MSSDYKLQIQKRLEELPNDCAEEVLRFLQFLAFKVNNQGADRSSLLLSEQSLLKEWSTPEEDKAWQHL